MHSHIRSNSPPLCEALGGRATLRLFDDADHSFHVPARSGRTDAQVRGEMIEVLAGWIDGVLGTTDEATERI